MQRLKLQHCLTPSALHRQWQLYAMPYRYGWIVGMVGFLSARDGLVGSRLYLLFVRHVLSILSLSLTLSLCVGPRLTVKWRCRLSIWQVSVVRQLTVNVTAFCVSLIVPCRLKINQQAYWIAVAVGQSGVRSIERFQMGLRLSGGANR